MSKSYRDMTPEERAAFLARYEVQAKHQRTVKAYEASLDAILGYLKTTRRKRTAPTMLYQYPGFFRDELLRLVQDFERAYEAQEAAHEQVMAEFRPKVGTDA